MPIFVPGEQIITQPMAENELKIDIESIINKVQTDYYDGDIVVIKSVKSIPTSNPCKLEMMIVIYCANGSAQFCINNSFHRIEKGNIMICLPNSLIADVNASEDIDLKIIGLSSKALFRSLDLSKNFWNIVLYASSNPVIKLNSEMQTLTNKFHNLLQLKQESKKGLFHKEIMRSLFQFAFYELAEVIASCSDNIKYNGVIRQGDLLFKRFLELLAENGGMERSVSAYAEKLCITPKYLSALSKKVSGRTALSWIHQFTIDAIIKRLRYSNMTIKEISDAMNFPNISFFGKFVKSQTGMSPSEYKRNIYSFDKK